MNSVGVPLAREFSPSATPRQTRRVARFLATHQPSPVSATNTITPLLRMALGLTGFYPVSPPDTTLV